MFCLNETETTISNWMTLPFLIPLSFPCLFPIWVSSSAYTPQSSPFFFLASSFSTFLLPFSPFQAKTFLLIRESAEWNHRGVCSLLTLFIFPLPPCALRLSANEGALTLRMCVAYTRVLVCITSLNYSDVVASTWQRSAESPDVNQRKGLCCIQSPQLHYHMK